MKIDPFPGTLTKQPVRHNSMGYVLTDEQREWLCRWFPEEENNRLVAASGMSHSTLHRFARELGLTKSEEGIRRIRKRHGARIKKLCEKNGYYDSLRGKPPSEACLRGTAQMWQDIRDGKREHPIRVLKRKSPGKYRKYKQRKSEQRKEAIRKDRIRLHFGLPQKTRMKLCYNGYGQAEHRKAVHRHVFRKHGYIVEHGSDTVYYNDETDRRPRMEARAAKYGLRVMEAS